MTSSGTGDERLFDLFEDLEQQAQGLQLADRDVEVADRARAEYAREVDLASRVHASLGRQVTLTVLGVGAVQGTLASAGRDWCLLDGGGSGEWVVRLPAVLVARGLSERALAERARPVAGRLHLSSSLRRLADARRTAVVATLDGTRTRGRIARVGTDFFELVMADRSGRPDVVLISTAHVAAVRGA